MADGLMLLQRSPGIAAGDRTRPGPPASTSSRFNGAPASRPGIGGAIPERHRAVVASTEPRHRGRGSCLGTRADGPVAVASTEPRHRGRGSVVVRASSTRSRWLQRSPGIAAGDRKIRVRVCAGPASLQRSPGIAAGDRSRNPASPCRCPCFNGAPASRPGIALARRPHPRGRGRFNGAPASRPGIGSDGRLVRRDVPASTEPRHRGRGSESRAGWRCRGRTRFNGAPASRPGIVSRAVPIPGGEGASTEPRHRGRGS